MEVERRLVFVGDAAKVLRNLVVNTFFKTTRDALFFVYAVKLEGAVCTAYSFLIPCVQL